jgi:hypothetical protein
MLQCWNVRTDPVFRRVPFNPVFRLFRRLRQVTSGSFGQAESRDGALLDAKMR